MRRLTVILFLISVLAGWPAQADMTGAVRVIDGDTLDMNGTEIDLFGIDAPEPDQTCLSRKGKVAQCGQLAIQYLAVLLGNRPVNCRELTPTAEGRTQGRCQLGWLDLSENMVSEGWALPDPVTGAEFKRAETFARARKEGMWRGTFLPAWEWRAGKRLVP